jgi:NADH-quinone oxidoreductase subunit J
MTDPNHLLLTAALVAGVGLWLLLPRVHARSRALGALLGAAGLGILGAALPGLPDWISQSAFWVLAGVTIVSAAAAMTLQNPVYCAIWFGLSLLGTSGLFFLQGAQFLAVATVVVYAGAILVTFLFILMLAQPSGRASYDRVSWEGLLSAACATFLVGVLSMTVAGALATPEAHRESIRITTQQRQSVVLAEEHVKQLGIQLFGRYLVAVEVVAVLLLAALVGAAVIVGHAKGPLVGPLSSAEVETSDASDCIEPDASDGFVATADGHAVGGTNNHA